MFNSGLSFKDKLSMVDLQNIYLYSFGGYLHHYLDCVHKYNIAEDSWTKLAGILPTERMNNFKLASIMNGRYILLFGGNIEGNPIDDIYIYLVRDQVFQLSKVSCPVKGKCHVIAVNDKEKEELTVHGFVRC